MLARFEGRRRHVFPVATALTEERLWSEFWNRPHAAIRIDQTMTERTIFLAAIDITDPAERATYVEQACGGDVNLRAQVEQLLSHHNESSQFLEKPAGTGSSAVELTIVSHGADDDDDDRNSAALSGEEELRKYLQPSSRPGWLGRLAHYEIEQILGRGAFGIVVKAFDEKLHRVVAIKLMNPDLASTSPPRKRFLREARTAAAVRNEHIVGIYAVEEEPLPYLVMEYVPGMTLQQRLDQDGPVELSEILRIGQQVASGLAAAHAANLIHRDIKPSNILLEGDIENRAKISDFGLARAVDDASLTSSGLIAGTPMYMAPEQARGEVLDHRADLFSLGSVLYQMASGRPPFRASNTVAVLKRVCEDTPRPIHDVIPGTAEWLCAIIMRLLEKKPSDRFQTAKEVAELFARCQAELQLNGKVTCVQSRRIQENSETAPSTSNAPSLDQSAAQPAIAQPSATGQGSSRRSETATLKLPSILYGIMLGVMMLVPILFGKQLSSYVNALIWPAIPALPATASSAGLEFDGKDDFVSIEAVNWSYPQFTIEAFVTSARDSDNGTIVHLGSGGEKLEWMSLYDDHPADPGKRLSGAAIKGKTPFANTSAPFTAGVRQHRVLVFDGRYMHYYVNGIWQAKRFAEAHEGLMWKMKNLRIACDGSERRFFQGRIDQVRISRIARYDANFAPVTSLTSDDSTLALYNFNEGTGEVLQDASGNGHDGKIVGARWVKAASDAQSSTIPPSPDLADSALKFDGQIATQVDIPSIEIVEGQPITLEGFFTPQGLCYNRDEYQQFMGTSYHSLHVPPKGDGSWRWVWTFGRERNDDGLRWCDGPRCIEQSRVHIACIHDNGELRIYFDGVRVSATRDSINPLTKNDKFSGFKIGAGFIGLIDEVRVSSIARYQEDFVPQTRFDVDDNTVALYHFDEGEGDRLHDASGNGHDGKIVGAKWVNGSRTSEQISTQPVLAQDSTLPVPETEWTSLFDGTVATGWQQLGAFQVISGMLISKGGWESAITEKQYADFEFEAEWKVGINGDGGIFYRELATQTRAGTALSFHDDVGLAESHKEPTQKTGSLYGIFASRNPIVRPAGEWNRLRIVCCGSRVEHWLNDSLQVSYDVNSDEWKTATQASFIKSKDNLGARKGHILLRSYNTEVAFRRLRIREYPELDRVSQLSPEEQVTEFTAEMKRRNPEWDGVVTPTIADGQVVGITVDSLNLKDLSPIVVFSSLRELNASSSKINRELSDLTPLAQMKSLTAVFLGECEKIVDLSPLRDLPITSLIISNSGVSDLSPIAGKPLQLFNANYCVALTDLAPLRGAPLQFYLGLEHSGVTDLTPIRESLVGVLAYNADRLENNWEAIKNWPLIDFQCFHEIPTETLSKLKEIKTLEKIDSVPLEEYLKSPEKSPESN